MIRDMHRLEQRIADLERGSGRVNGQLSGLEEDVLLLEDRVEAHRLSLERRGMVRARSRDELPRYHAPARVAEAHERPASIENSAYDRLPTERVTPRASTRTEERSDPASARPAGVPHLPVVTATPESVQTSDEDEAVEELLITNETLRAFVDEHGGAPVASAGGSASSGGSRSANRRPLPPVVVGDRLPSGSASSTPAAPATTASQGATTPATSVAAASPSGAGIPLYQESLRAFNAGDYRGARLGFQRFLDEGAPFDYQDNAMFWIGECHYAEGSFTAALETFEQVVRDYPDGNKIPDSLLKIGLTYERLNNLGSATEVLTMLVETYPTTDAARRASERLAGLN